MTAKLDHAINLYLEGIRDGDLGAIDRYTGSRYTQHSTGVADGKAGFRQFFEDFLRRTTTRDIRVIRAIEDGSHVFLHVYQDIDDGAARWVTADLFDTDDNDKIVEHWDTIAAYVPPEKTKSGRDVVLGAFEVTDLERTEANKALVRRLFVDVFQNGNHDALDQYLSSDTYHQHSANGPDGTAAIKQLLAEGEVSYDFVFKVIGQGDHVVSYSKVTYRGEELAVFDIFRVQDGKIVEHWETTEPIPPRPEWANTGKF